MSTEFEMLQDHEEELVEALADIDLVRLSHNLLRCRVITKEMMKTITSLDHDRLDSQTRTRYLLHLVYVRVKYDSILCTKFHKVLCEVNNESVVKIGMAVAQSREGAEVKADIAAESKLFKKDVGDLMDILAEVSYKWEEISISLKLPIASIEECRNASNNKLRLHKALTEWVCGNHKHAKPPTLTNLRETLASDTVQLWRLAGEIEEKLKVKMAGTDCPLVKDPQLSNCLEIQYESMDTEVVDGKSTLLEVQVCPRESVSYQWMKGGQPLSESSAFSGTCSAMLLINQASQGREGEYHCHLSHGSEQLITSKVAVTVIYPPEKKCLINLYKALDEIPQDSWPFISANTFVDLALIKSGKVIDSSFFIEREMEDILEKREKVEYTDAFGKYERRALVLVEGRPGSGKTTLAHKIAKDWANGTALQNVCLVLLISLRKDQEKSEIYQTVFQSQSEVFQRKLEETSGDGICFILDGYDEYSPRHGDKSVINQHIQKTYLPLAMVIVTSRPVATVTLRPKATRRVEILGFTKKNFNEFVSSYPFECFVNSDMVNLTKSNLMTYLKACTNVLNMCYLPVNASIICFVYSQNLGDSIPKTETDIYESFVIAIILRKLRLDDPSIQLHSLKDLHGDNRDYFNKICSIGFKMTVEQKQIVHELPMSLDSLNNSLFRGLLTIDLTAKLFGLENVVTFLHLTLQEYLAAYYLAIVEEDQQMKMIKLLGGKNHMRTTFKFYCGLLNLQHKKYQFDEITVGNSDLDEIEGSDPLYMFHCAYESQQEIICYRVMEILKGIISLLPGVLTPADFTALGYVISTASLMVTKVQFNQNLLYEDFVDDKLKCREVDKTDPLAYSFETAAIGSFMGFKTSIEDLLCTHISYSFKPQFKQVKYKLNEVFDGSLKFDYHSGVVKHYLECSSDIFSSDSALPLADALKQCTNLQFLVLIGHYKSRRSARAIANIFKNCTDLHEVEICAPMPSPSMVLVVEGLQHCKHLHTLFLTSIDLCSDGAAVLAKGLIECTCLEQLELVDCSINSEGAVALAAGLTAISLKEFRIPWNSFGYIGALALGNVFCLEILEMSHNNIGSEGTKCLARGILENPILSKLILDKNEIGPDGIVELAEGLSCCADLQFPSLSHNDVGSDGVAALAQGLKFCNQLQALKLQNCNLSLDGILTLAESFVCWRKLSTLNLSDNGIILDGTAAVIAGGLQFLNHLQHLYLSNNTINSSSAVALAEGLQCCPFLHTLDMSKNSIGSAGAVALAGALMSKEMNYVNLSHNNIDIESVETLAILVQASHLQRLDLSYNNINSTGGLILITELISYDHPVRLNLQFNNVSSKATKFFSNITCRNTNLHVLLSSPSQTSLKS